MSKVYFYVGTTTMCENDFFGIFDNIESNENKPERTRFREFMGIDWYDEDFAFAEYSKNKSLDYFNHLVSDVISVDIPENILDLYDNIDFIIVIEDNGFSDINPKRSTFENEHIKIQSIGCFEANDV